MPRGSFAMMRSGVVVIALISLSGSALAQPSTNMANCAGKAIQYADALQQNDIAVASAQQQCGTITMEIGHTRILKLDRQFKSIIIGNPNVAEVTVQDPHTLLITAKAPDAKDKTGTGSETGPSGTRTNLMLLDNANEPIYSLEIEVSSEQSLGHVRIYAGQRKEIQDYIPYACTTGDCTRLEMEVQKELTKEIVTPGGGDSQTTQTYTSVSSSGRTYQSRDVIQSSGGR